MREDRKVGESEDRGCGVIRRDRQQGMRKDDSGEREEKEKDGTCKRGFVRQTG